MIKEVERKMNAGEDVPECFAKNLLLCREEEGFNWTDICTLVGGFMIGGVETVRAGQQLLYSEMRLTSSLADLFRRSMVPRAPPQLP